MALVLRYIPVSFTPNGRLVYGPDEKGKYKLHNQKGKFTGFLFPEDPHRIADWRKSGVK